MDYRIVLVDKHNSAVCFNEIAVLLKHSLNDLGHACDITFDILDKDKINIVLGVHNLIDKSILLSYNYIIYQLEVLSLNEGYYNDIKGALFGAKEIWDYSENNIKFLEKQGFNAKHVPVGYHKRLELIPKQTIKDVDILFVGSMNDRRADIMSIFNKDKSIKFVYLYGVFGHQRDSIISRSKLLLNVHFYESKVFEVVRMSYLWNNDIKVISEDSVDYPYKKIEYKMFKYDVLVDNVYKALKSVSNFSSKYEEFKKHYQMVEIMESIA